MNRASGEGSKPRCPNQVSCTKEGKRGEPSELAATAFRIEEKKYKLVKLDKRTARQRQRFEEPLDIGDVVDARAPTTSPHRDLLIELPAPSLLSTGSRSGSAGRKVKVLAFAGVPGLFLLPSFLNDWEQLELADAALHDFSRSEAHPNNLVQLEPSAQTQRYELGMRWATLGFSYDWTRKAYHKSEYSTFPAGVRRVIRNVNSVMGEHVGITDVTAGHSQEQQEQQKAIEDALSAIHTAASEVGAEMGHVDRLPPPPSLQELRAAFDGYEPQTAIVNYFPVGSQMMAHQDISEEAMHRPLYSVSLGCSAIFLMGTASRDDKPFAFFLRSGDVAVFTGPARTAFHAVPRIIDDTPPLFHHLTTRIGACGCEGSRNNSNGMNTVALSAAGDAHQCAHPCGCAMAKQGTAAPLPRPMLGLRININVRQVFEEDMSELLRGSQA